MSRKGKDAGEYRRLMEEVVDQAVLYEASDRPPPPKEPQAARWVVFTILAGAAVAVAAWNVSLARAVAPPLPAHEQEAALRGVVTVLSRQIETLRGTTGAYPATLDPVAPPLDGVTYQRADSGFVLEAAAGKVVVTFDSRRDPPIRVGRAGDAAGVPR